MSRQLTVLEWRDLPIAGDEPGDGELSRREAERLHKLAATAQTNLKLGGGEGESVLQLRPRSVRAQQVVGLLADRDVTLEILPKIDSVDEAGARHVLVEMLARVLDLPIAPGELAALSQQDRALLEIIITLLTRRLFELVHRGLPRAYVRRHDDLPALRGRLDVVRQFSVRAASPQRLACEFDELSADILPNRILRTAITRLRGLSRSLENQRRLAELDFAFDGVRPFAPGEMIPFDRVILDRTHRGLAEPLMLARFILERSYQTTSSGGARGFALLFEMNTLFEEFAGRMTQRVWRDGCARVTLQGPRGHVLRREDGRPIFATKPDIYIGQPGGDVVIDTKWKRLDAKASGGRFGVGQGDIYQMMAYAHVYPVERLILLYPHHGALSRPPGLQARYFIAETEQRIEIATVDVAQSGLMGQSIRALVECGRDVPEDERFECDSAIS